MTIGQPKRHYLGIFSDTHHWGSFQHRSGDVFVCVPPKSGTTWMQTICGLLIFGDPDADTVYPEVSPWIEFRMNPRGLAPRLALLEAQTHQRFIKSHSPLDGIPYFEDCTYLVGHRHPLDVHFSMYNHVHNMRMDDLDHLYTDDVDYTLDAFLNGEIEGIGFDQPSLAFLAHHLETAREMADSPNVHMFHYDSLLRDLRGQMQRVARAIGVSYSVEQLEKLAEKATFTSMKASALRTAPGAASGLFKDPSAFFKSGTSGGWQNKLNDQQIARYKAKINVLLNPEDVRYIETGVG